MSRKRTKQYLMLLLVVGLVSIAAGGGGGTFASFNAQVTNPGNYFASGTLFLHNTHQGVTCTSESASGNVNPGDGSDGDTCDTLFTLPMITPGTTYTAHLVLDNAGTIDAQDITMSSAGCTDGNGTTVHALLNGAVTSGASSTTTLTVLPLSGTITSGDHVTVSSADGQHKQTFVTTAGASAGDTSISVTAQNWNYSYADQSDVTDTDSAVAAPAFATASLCGALKMSVEETDNSLATQRCSYGTTLGAASCTLASGTALSSISSSPTNLSLTPNLGSNTNQLLSAGQSREFDIKVLAPASMNNTYQDRGATFDLTWNIDQ